MEHFCLEDAIEGEKIAFEVKRINTSSAAYRKSRTGFIGLKVKCSRDCDAKICTQLTPENIELIRKNLKCEKVFTDENERIRGECLFFISEIKKFSSINYSVKPFSGQHECSAFTLKYRTYAEIDKPFKSISNAIENRLLFERQSLKNIELK